MVLCGVGLVTQLLQLLELRWLPHLRVNRSQTQGYLRRHCSHRAWANAQLSHLARTRWHERSAGGAGWSSYRTGTGVAYYMYTSMC